MTGEVVSYLSSVMSVETSTATLTSITVVGTTTTAGGNTQYTGAAAPAYGEAKGKAMVGMVGFVAGMLALL